MDRETVQKFYFSNCSSFTSFKQAKDKQETRASSRQGRRDDQQQQQQQADQSTVNVSNVNLSMPSSIQDDSTAGQQQNQQQQQHTDNAAAAASTPPVTIAGGSALNVIRSGAPRIGAGGSASASAKKKAGGSSKTSAKPVDAASEEYFAFLKKQQELQRYHNTLEETQRELEENRRDRQSSILKVRRQARELMQGIEGESDWKLKSKYNTQDLVRDCKLALQPIELVEERPAPLQSVEAISNQLATVKEGRGETEQFEPHRLWVDQSLRRLSLLEKVLKEGNCDPTPVSRLSDTLLIQLENVIALPTVESMVVSIEESVEREMFKIEEARQKREAAVSEGEVHIAERLCYDIIEYHENILEHAVTKAQSLGKAIEECQVVERVRKQYFSKTPEEFEKISVRSRKTKSMCEDDLKKMFALREEVENVEAGIVSKVMGERLRSDRVLDDNAKKLDTVFLKISELEKEAEVLERERHKEIQKRLVEKDKDEHRKAEYAQFCGILGDHTQPLERTIKNMDIMIHHCDVMQELVTGGFHSLEVDLGHRERLLKDVKLETHKQHLEVFRGVLLELGEIIYKKERMVEETDKNVRQAHVQQELLAETFNPNAKRFGVAKKKLLATRDELESDVQELKGRASKALDAFTYSEEALESARVEFVHPVTEQEHQRLAMKARMIEFKALAAGHTEGNMLVAEIDELKQSLNQSKMEIDAINVDTTGTMSKALPMIRAATKSVK